MGDNYLIIVAIMMSMIYFFIGIQRKKKQIQNKPKKIVPPDPDPELETPLADESESEPALKVTLQELRDEYIYKKKRISPDLPSEDTNEPLDQVELLEEQHSLEPRYKHEKLNLEKLVVENIVTEEAQQDLPNGHDANLDSMKDTSSLRNAFILSQILDRPYKDDDTF